MDEDSLHTLCSALPKAVLHHIANLELIFAANSKEIVLWSAEQSGCFETSFFMALSPLGHSLPYTTSFPILFSYLSGYDWFSMHALIGS